MLAPVEKVIVSLEPLVRIFIDIELYTTLFTSLSAAVATNLACRSLRRENGDAVAKR